MVRLGLLRLIKVKLSLSAAANWRTASNLHHRPLDDLIHLRSDMRYFILAVKVPFYDFVGFNEPIKLSLQLVILLCQNSLVAVKLLQLPSEVVVPLNKGFVAIFHALNVPAEALDV